ncbi:alpha/beta hydrolase [Blastopirellula marina]|uniref:Alpha/beta hydrolase n=2 Tax=Blastopirellula marina TaxID=124 RepID=A0A2S8G280_9BACT|nr:alpha/beta hydrolase [Blastopirellula marina]PTL45028.1 alpha/beta hydrolase [Blastopirellula marina]
MFVLLAWGSLLPAEEPAVRMVPNQLIAERADKTLRADVYLPAGEGPFPAVLMIHGGAWAGGSRSNMAANALFLANNGYAVATISYRFAPSHVFPAQLEDCQAGLTWLVENAEKFHIDTDRLASWGHSAGGHLACLIATTESEKEPSTPQLKAVVAGAAPCDFTHEPLQSKRLSFFLGGSRAEKPSTYVLASPVSHVTAKCPPIFFFHGTEDNVVPIQEAEAMHQKLSSLGVPTAFYKSIGRGHIGSLIDPEARREALKFLDGQLKLGGS